MEETASLVEEAGAGQSWSLETALGKPGRRGSSADRRGRDGGEREHRPEQRSPKSRCYLKSESDREREESKERDKERGLCVRVAQEVSILPVTASSASGSRPGVHIFSAPRRLHASTVPTVLFSYHIDADTPEIVNRCLADMNYR